MKPKHLLCSLTRLAPWLLALGINQAGWAANTAKVTSYVDLVTSQGTVTVGLYGESAPVTVKNFLNYVTASLYDGTIISSLKPDFVFQGGYIDIYGQPIVTFPPIINEAGSSGLSNLQWTIAMARGSDPNSATSQFFFNLVDNAALLDYGSQNAPAGYAVFGTTVAGQSVVQKIGSQTPFNIQSLPFPVTPAGQMITIQGTFPYSLAEGATPRLRVLLAGSGGGVVRTQPGGVCRQGDCSFKVKSGKKINLTATPAAGHYFVGWSGDCVGGDRKTSVIASSETPSSTNCVAVFQAR